MWTEKTQGRETFIEIKVLLERTQGRMHTSENNEYREKNAKWNEVKWSWEQMNGEKNPIDMEEKNENPRSIQLE